MSLRHPVVNTKWFWQSCLTNLYRNLNTYNRTETSKCTTAQPVWLCVCMCTHVYNGCRPPKFLVLLCKKRFLKKEVFEQRGLLKKEFRLLKKEFRLLKKEFQKRSFEKILLKEGPHWLSLHHSSLRLSSNESRPTYTLVTNYIHTHESPTTSMYTCQVTWAMPKNPT